MDASAIQADLLHMTERYYYRLHQLLELLPDDALETRLGVDALSPLEMLRHVAASELWYLKLLDGDERELPPATRGREAVQAWLAYAQEEMSEFIADVDEASLVATYAVPTWWGEGEERSGLLVLMHSLAHKYYHCGQLKDQLNALGQATA